MIYLYEAFKSVIPLFVILSVLVFFLVVWIDLRFKVEAHVLKQLIKIFVHFGLIMSFIGIMMVTGLPSDNPEKVTQFEPFTSIIETYQYATGYGFFNAIIMNIVLFIPFSMCLYLISKRLIFTFFVSLLFSVGIEVMQYILPIGRISNVDDVILNTTGALIGIIFGLILRLFPPFRLGSKPDKGATYNEMEQQN